MKPIIKESEYLYTLDEVAEIMGLSRSIVGDAQRSALEKLRVALEKRGYVADDFLEKGNEEHGIADRSPR
jgi:DNA-directed RNA polymerase sigma subunit (sigma70/sigma32)